MMGVEDLPVARVAEALTEVTSSVGLTMDEVMALLVSGVKVTDLLEYAQAVASNRLN